MATTNPAKRLLGFLRRFRDSKKQNNSSKDAWASTFNCHHGDTEKIQTNLYKLVRLTDEIETQVLDRGGNKDTYLADLPSIRSGLLLPPYKISYDETVRYFGDGALTRLEFCSELLSAEAETEIDEPTLKDIKIQVETFCHLILESNISSFLRRCLFELAETARRAIADYEILGVKKLRSTYYQMIGVIACNNAELEKPENGPIKKTMISLGNGLARAVEISANLGTLIEFTADKLPKFLP